MQELLKNQFGIDNFKSDAEKQVAEAILRGNRDVYIYMANKTDRSLCFQIPVLMKNNSLAIIITTSVISAMEQVRYLRSKNIVAYCWNANMPKKMRNIMKNDMVSKKPKMKLLYITPEQCDSVYFEVLLSEIKPGILSYFVIDEALCLLPWNNNFRHQNQKLIRLRCKCPSIPLVIITSAPSEEIKVQILDILSMKSPLIFLIPEFQTCIETHECNKLNKSEILEEKLKMKADVQLEKIKRILYKNSQKIVIEPNKQLRIFTGFCGHLQKVLPPELQLEKIKRILYKNSQKIVIEPNKQPRIFTECCEHLQGVLPPKLQLEKIKKLLYKN